MTAYYTGQFRDIQDKTTYKGVYFFLSISIVFFIINLNPDNNLSNFLNIFESYELYIIILSVSSILTAFLYYFKGEILIFKLIIILKNRKGKFPKYKNVKLHSGIDHIFISSIKDRFFSKVLFTLTLLFISLSFINEAYSFIIVTFFLIFIGLLIVWIVYDNRELNLVLKLIYFMKLFIQDNKMITDPTVKEFSDSLKNNLWFKAKQNFKHFIEKHLRDLYLYNRESDLKFLEVFYETCESIIERHDPNQNNEKLVTEVLSRINTEVYKSKRFDLNRDSSLLTLEEKIDLFYDFIHEIGRWDEWLLKYVFYTDDFSIGTYDIVNLKRLYNKKAAEKLYNYHVGVEYSQKEKKQNIIESSTGIINNYLSITGRTHLKGFCKKTLYDEKLRIILQKIRDKTVLLDKELKLKKHLNKKYKQKIFDALNNILQFYYNNINKDENKYEGSHSILSNIKLLREFEEDLDLLDIECYFIHSNEIYFEPFRISICWNENPLNIFEEIITKISPDTNLDKVDLKNSFKLYLEKRGNKFNFKFKNLEFWQ
ncbi:hypothetical protein LCGC14_1478860 [marine sediment metagenome]|uniref:Uncharacterized protein n=1 Tax=marine sediment metagenome TaxID=412755 RepID=A0A0F9JW28_9ZZZZ